MAAMTSAAVQSAITSVPTTRVFAQHSGLRATPSFVAIRYASAAPAFRRLSISCAASPETLTKVQGIIATQLAVEAEKITPEAKFVDLGADSLDTVEIMMALEEQFDITLAEDNAEKIATVQDAADLIEEQVTAKA